MQVPFTRSYLGALSKIHLRSPRFSGNLHSVESARWSLPQLKHLRGAAGAAVAWTFSLCAPAQIAQLLNREVHLAARWPHRRHVPHWGAVRGFEAGLASRHDAKSGPILVRRRVIRRRTELCLSLWKSTNKHPAESGPFEGAARNARG